MNLRDFNTAGMTYNPSSLDFMPRMEMIPEFKGYDNLFKEEVFRYIALMYDINSPVRKYENDYYLRKRLCAELAGFKKKDDKFQDEVENIILFSNNEAAALTVIFITSFSSPDYFNLILNWESMQRIMLDMSNKKKIESSIIKEMDLATKRVNDLTKSLFNSGDLDEIKIVKKLLYRSADMRKNQFRPEDIAKELMNGGYFNEGNPYGDNYNVDGLKFLGDDEEIAKRKFDEL